VIVSRETIHLPGQGRTIMDPHALRQDRTLRSLRDEGLDAVLVSNPVNVTYLTGFTGDSSYLILSPKRTLLVSDARYSTQLAEECPGLQVHIRPPSRTVQEAAGEVLDQLGLRAVGFESAHLTVADHETLCTAAPAVSWKGARDRIERLRAIKDEDEIRQVRQAIAIAERAFGQFCAALRPTDTEKELCDTLEMLVRRAGGAGTSFPPIVAVGDRSALPHAPPTSRTVAEADLLLIDWGASGPLYKSDLTRILLTRNNPVLFEQVAEVHRVVLAAQAAALQALRPGVKAAEVDTAARSLIAEAGYGEHFGHGLGHGFGLQIHEAPFLKPGNEAVLQAGMVLTIEPGIYLPGQFGVRIEDDVLVTPDGCEVLTNVPRDLPSLVLRPR
jgi:Xaa-Pro aminopeptidase